VPPFLRCKPGIPSVFLAEALRDRYPVERELGRGGMATVYLAHDWDGRAGFQSVLRRGLDEPDRCLGAEGPH
jgi:hypothetical protein